MNLNFKSAALTLVAGCLFFVAFAVWTISSPVGSAPDEDFHQNMIYCSAGKSAACELGGIRYGHCYSMRPTVSGDCGDYSDRPVPVATIVNFTATLPLYYQVAQFFVSETLGDTTIKIRLMNSSMAVVLGLISLLLTGPAYRLQAFLALILSSVPAGLFFLTSISPSAWAIMSVALLVGPFYSLVDAGYPVNLSVDFSRAMWTQYLRILFMLLLIAMGVGSRYETMIWLPLLFLFTAMVNLNRIRRLPLSTSAWLLIASIIILSAVILIPALFGRSPMPVRDLVTNVLSNMFSWWTFEKSFNTLFGMMSLTGIPGAELGTHDAPISPIASFFVSVAIGGAILGGLANASSQHFRNFCMLIFVIFFVTAVLWSMQDWDYYQPRYFLPIFCFIIFFSLIRKPVNTFFVEQRYWLMVFTSISIVYSLSLLSTVLRFIYGIQFQQTRFPLGKEAVDLNPARLFDAPIPRWWLSDMPWLTPFSIWVIGSASFLCASLLGWFLIKRRLEVVISGAEGSHPTGVV